MSSVPDRLRSPAALQRTYTALASLYDALVPSVSHRARTLGHSWIEAQDGEQLLEVGTGTGLAFQHLVAANPRGWTVGVDLTPAMIRRARKRMAGRPHTRYCLHEARATALPYAPNTFDAVFSGYLIDVLASVHIRPALREMHRVLHPEGRLVLVYWAAPRRRIERLWGMLAHALPPLFGGARPVHLRAPLRAAGFHVEARTSCLQGGLRSAVVRAQPA